MSPTAPIRRWKRPSCNTSPAGCSTPSAFAPRWAASSPKTTIASPARILYAVLSYDYWTRRFARDPNVIGRNFRLDDRLYEIVGVGPEPFTGTETGAVTDIFLPTMMHPAASTTIGPGIAPSRFSTPASPSNRCAPS